MLYYYPWTQLSWSPWGPQPQSIKSPLSPCDYTRVNSWQLCLSLVNLFTAAIMLVLHLHLTDSPCDLTFLKEPFMMRNKKKGLLPTTVQIMWNWQIHGLWLSKVPFVHVLQVLHISFIVVIKVNLFPFLSYDCDYFASSLQSAFQSVSTQFFQKQIILLHQWK